MCVCASVMLSLGTCHNDLGAACWCWFNVVIMRCELIG